MQITFHRGTLLAALVGMGLALGACSSSSSEPSAISVDEYFQRIQALHDTQERQSEEIAQRFAEQLDGDEADIDEVVAEITEILPEFLPAFRAVLTETRDGLDEITAPSVAERSHEDLITAYDEFVALIDSGVEELEGGQPPNEVLGALFIDRAGTELGQRFTAIAEELTEIAERSGVEDFTGGGALVIASAGQGGTSSTGGRGSDDSPEVVVGSSAGMGPGIPVAEAHSSTLDQPLLVNGFIFTMGDETWLCDSLPREEYPTCGEPSIPVAGLDPSAINGMEFLEGRGWSNEPMQVLGEVIDGVLSVSGRALSQ